MLDAGLLGAPLSCHSGCPTAARLQVGHDQRHDRHEREVEVKRPAAAVHCASDRSRQTPTSSWARMSCTRAAPSRPTGPATPVSAGGCESHPSARKGRRAPSSAVTSGERTQKPGNRDGREAGEITPIPCKSTELERAVAIVATTAASGMNSAPGGSQLDDSRPSQTVTRSSGSPTLVATSQAAWSSFPSRRRE